MKFNSALNVSAAVQNRDEGRCLQDDGHGQAPSAHAEVPPGQQRRRQVPGENGSKHPPSPGAAAADPRRPRAAAPTREQAAAETSGAPPAARRPGRGRAPCPPAPHTVTKGREGTAGTTPAAAARGPRQADPHNEPRNSALRAAPREGALPPRGGPGAPEAAALLTPTTLSPLLPDRGAPLPAHLPPPLRDSAKPYRVPGRARRGDAAARSQWPGAGGERARRQRGAAGPERAEAGPARAYRAGPGRAREAAGAPRAAPCDCAAPSWGQSSPGGGGAAPAERDGGFPPALSTTSAFAIVFFLLPPRCLALFHKAVPDRWKLPGVQRGAE